ncbi:MAG: carboxypeptidase-like regulatory domain-containing protein [Bacteroidota bacterium]
MKYWICWLLPILPQLIWGQTLIEGIVLDSAHQAIPYANVYLSPVEDAHILIYTSTNAEGAFQLSYKEGMYDLHVKAYGYEEYRQSITISDSSSSSLQNLQVQLQNRDLLLDEVVIEASGKVIQKNDTIVFKADAFKTGEEKVVEDLLRKLPGVEVSESGAVSVNGKAVQTIMIENDNLFDNNYRLASRNLDVDVIESVEILQDFSDNPLLKDVKDSDDVAINLTLKEDRKRLLFGNVRGAYGIGQRYEGKLNLISISPKAKAFVLASTNNLGTNPVGDIFQLLNPNLFSGKKIIGDGIVSKELVRPETYSIPHLPAIRYTNNRARFSSLSTVLRPSKRLKIKLLAYYFGDRNPFEYSRTTTYLLDSPIEIQEGFSTNKHLRSGLLRMHATYFLSPTSNLEYTGVGSVSHTKSDNRLLFNQMDITENLHTQHHFLDQQLQFTQKHTQTSASVFRARFFVDDKPQIFNISPGIHQDIFLANPTYTQIQQASSQPVKFMAMSWDYFHRTPWGNISIRPHIYRHTDQMYSSIRLLDHLDQDMFQDILPPNELSFVRTHSSVRGMIKRQIGPLGLSVGTGLHYQHITVNTIKDNQTFFYLTPRVGLKWKASRKHHISGLYAYNAEFSSVDQIFPQMMFQSYRELTKGFEQINQSQHASYVFSYRYGNFEDEFTFYTNVSYFRRKHTLESQIQVFPTFSLAQYFQTRRKDFYSMNLVVDRFFPSLFSNIKLKVNVTGNAYMNSLNEMTRDVAFSSRQVSAEYRSVWAFPLNIHLKLGLRQGSYQISDDQKISNLNGVNFFETRLKISNNFQSQTRLEHYALSVNGKMSHYFFLDSHWQYELNKNSFSLGLNMKNLLKQEEFIQTLISDTDRQVERTKLIRRYILLEAFFRF